jgi:hypothetical protein
VGHPGPVGAEYGGATSVTAGISYYDYVHIQGFRNLNREWDSTSNSFFGNSSNGSGANATFANDYNLMELFAEFTTKISWLPLAAFGSYVQNLGVEDGYDEDTGWLMGFRVNKAVAPKSWEFTYEYRDIGADAVIGQFTDSDFAGGGSDVKGHRLNVIYQIAKNVQGSLTYYANQITRTTEIDYSRIQADILVRFK